MHVQLFYVFSVSFCIYMAENDVMYMLVLLCILILNLHAYDDFINLLFPIYAIITPIDVIHDDKLDGRALRCIIICLVWLATYGMFMDKDQKVMAMKIASVVLMMKAICLHSFLYSLVSLALCIINY